MGRGGAIAFIDPRLKGWEGLASSVVEGTEVVGLDTFADEPANRPRHRRGQFHQISFLLMRQDNLAEHRAVDARRQPSRDAAEDSDRGHRAVIGAMTSRFAHG